jgi:hypothetical protein
MFRPTAIRLAARLAEAVDQLLIGDFDFIQDESGIYADVDYDRIHPCRLELRAPIVRRQCSAAAPTPLTSAAAARR